MYFEIIIYSFNSRSNVFSKFVDLLCAKILFRDYSIGPRLSRHKTYNPYIHEDHNYQAFTKIFDRKIYGVFLLSKWMQPRMNL